MIGVDCTYSNISLVVHRDGHYLGVVIALSRSLSGLQYDTTCYVNNIEYSKVIKPCIC